MLQILNTSLNLIFVNLQNLGVNKNMEHFWTIVQIAIFGIIFPLLDSGGDVNFSIRAIRNKHYQIGCLILSPVIAYIIFICSVWKKGNFDTKKERWFTWIFAVLTI